MIEENDPPTNVEMQIIHGTTRDGYGKTSNVEPESIAPVATCDIRTDENLASYNPKSETER